MNIKYLFPIALLAFFLYSCGDKSTETQTTQEIDEALPETVIEYGYVLDDFEVQRDTVRAGDSFGKILFDAKVDYATIQEISDSVKDIFDTRRIQVGKPFVLLKAKDTAATAQVFIYERNREDYVVVDFQDSIVAAAKKRPTTVYER
ncbi:MAG: hypothetical protein ACI86L_001363, partial [Dokdonia sp.]